MSRNVAAWFGILAGVSLSLGCGGGGGGGGEKPTTTYDLNGSYSYVLTPGTLSGNGARDCDPSDPASGTVDVTWTNGADHCQMVVDGTDTYTGSVNGNTMAYSRSETNYWGCDTYHESVSIHMSSADTASGAINWTCSWLDGGSTYSCSAKDMLAITRR